MLTKSIPDVLFTARDIGQSIANGDDEQQRNVLRAWAQGVDDMNQLKGSWAMQCRAIIDGTNSNSLSQSDRTRIALMLEELVAHLREPVAA